MKTLAQIWLICLLLMTADASAGPNVADQQSDIEAALVRGDPAEAAELARGMAQSYPGAFAPAFLLGLALLEQGEFDSAARTAAIAYGNALTSRDKQQAAQLAGNAWFSKGALTWAAIWLRRAANNAESEEEFLRIAETYAEVRAANPLDVHVGLWIAPMDNINGGAENEVFQLEGLPFEFTLPPDRVALSGLEFGADVTATYRLSRTSDQTTTVGVYVFGQSFALSPESRAQAPDLDGGDFSYVAADLSLTHERLIFVDLGPTALGVNGGRVWTGGAPTWDYFTVAARQGITMPDGASLTLRASQTRQVSRIGAAPVDLTQFSTAYRHPFAGGDVLETRFSAIYHDGGFENIYTEITAEAGYVWDRPVDGLQLSMNLMLGNRFYDTFPTTLDGRRDHFGRIGLDALFTGISYWGFSPQLSAAAMRTVSSAEEFTSRSLEARIGVRSTF